MIQKNAFKILTMSHLESMFNEILIFWVSQIGTTIIAWNASHLKITRNKSAYIMMKLNKLLTTLEHNVGWLRFCHGNPPTIQIAWCSLHSKAIFFSKLNFSDTKDSNQYYVLCIMTISFAFKYTFVFLSFVSFYHKQKCFTFECETQCVRVHIFVQKEATWIKLKKETRNKTIFSFRENFMKTLNCN